LLAGLGCGWLVNRRAWRSGAGHVKMGLAGSQAF